MHVITFFNVPAITMVAIAFVLYCIILLKYNHVKYKKCYIFVAIESDEFDRVKSSICYEFVVFATLCDKYVGICNTCYIFVCVTYKVQQRYVLDTLIRNLYVKNL